MNYLEASEQLKTIESSYDVMSIVYEGVVIWPFLRIYLMDSMVDSHRTQGYNKSNIQKVLKGMFFYNYLPLFRRHPIWIIGDCADRKLVEGKYQQSTTGMFPRFCDDFLELERPNTSPVHYKKEEIDEKNIISYSVVYFLSHIFEFLLKYKKISIQNEDIIDKILREYNIDFNYKYHLRYFKGQYNAMKIICKLTRLPKVVFVICPYTIMGSIRALKEKGVRIIEIQHGVINKNHYAYNGKYRSNYYFPDEICVYGDEEEKLFSSENYPYCKIIHKTGLYILDESLRCFKDDIFKEYRSRFSQIVVLAGQVTTDNQFIPFFLNLANMLPEVLFVYIPRGVPDVQPIEEKENLKYRAGVNIYEYLKWCDVHCTVSSTTCLEAHYFRKPTIFYNLNQLAENYYSSLLNDRNGVYYIDTEESFLKALRCIQKNEVFEYKQLYAKDGYVELSNLLKKYAEH